MFLDEITLSIVGIIAGIFILVGWVHQIIKGYRTKSLKDVSTYLMILISIGAILWLIYGIEIEDVNVIGTNLVAIVLMIIVMSMKNKYDKQNKIDVKSNSKN